jgi:DNA-binding NarL/FixJ family response regulator
MKKLSDHEVVILRRIAEGDKWDTIAGELRISKHTLNSHRTTIISKLGASNTTNAVYIASKTNLI